MEKTSLIEKAFLHRETLWSLHLPGEHVPIPQKTYLRKKDLEQHLNGEKTISVQLLHPVFHTVIAAAIDIDSGDQNDLTQALQDAKKIREAAKIRNVDLYLEFSGRRGFHVWCFIEGTISAAIARRMLLFFLLDAKVKAEVFPYGDSIVLRNSKEGSLKWEGDAYKPIKLPYGKHHCGGWSGFIDWECKDIDEMQFIGIEEFFSSVKKTRVSLIEEIASLYHDPGIPTLPKQNLDFSTFVSTHPECILALLKKGAPHDLQYNSANVIIGRYCNSRGLTDSDALELGKTMAESTNRQQTPHPTTKTLRKKIADFNGVWKHIKAHRSKYVWNCSYVFHSKDMLANHWCVGWDCPLYPHKKTEIEIPDGTAADSAIERDVVQFVLHYQSSVLEYGNIEEIPSEGFISSIKLNEKSKKIVPIFRFLFDICCQLIGRNIEIRDSTLLYEVQNQKRFEGYEPYISQIVERLYHDLIQTKPCSIETFQQETEILHERGIRILARRDLVTANKALSEREGGISQALSVVETLRTNMLGRGDGLNDVPYISKLPTLLKTLRYRVSLAIPTGFSSLDLKLAGGLQPRFYVITGLPGGGKSTLLAQIAYASSALAIPTLYLQYEMSTDDMYLNFLSMQTGLDSTILEQAKWDTDEGSAHFEAVMDATARQYEDLRFFQLIECGKDDTVYKIRSHIQRWKQKFQRLYNGDVPESRFLVIVDSTNHVTTGNPKIDADETLCSSWVGSELARMTRPSDTNSSIIGINELTKEGYKNVVKSGHSDMSSLRGSFRVSHSAHAIAILKSGMTDSGKDQIEVVYGNNQDKIDRIREAYPIEDWMIEGYSSLEFLKNRSGPLGSLLFVHEKAAHRFIPIVTGEEAIGQTTRHDNNNVLPSPQEDDENVF